ncbi:glycosyltransferase [Dechloromonas sp. A34]|uniref:glycosyltransferase n=1 Tax=Dechloromonas sp. A34 TaxID=447588 RepID=UPI00224954C4|nr:glycosyltransferase [Dechloromonas sp. A34]
MKPKLSIIIPTFDEAERNAGCLSALPPVRLAEVEIIVADDGREATTQPTSPLIDPFMHEARGPGGRMKAGAAAAQGEILLFLRSLTRLPERALNDLFSAFDSGARWGRCDRNSGGQNFLLKAITALISLRCRICGIALEEPAIFVQREAFFAIGGFPGETSTADLSTPAPLGSLGKTAASGNKSVLFGRRRGKHGVWQTIY